MDEQSAQEAAAAARIAALADDDANDRRVVEHKGVRYEVRAQSLKMQTAIKRRSMVSVKDPTGKPRKDERGQPILEQDENKAMVLTVIACTYVPGTDVRVYQDTDLDELLDKPINGKSLVLKLALAIGEVSKASPEEEEKNSESAPSSDSSIE